MSDPRVQRGKYVAVAHRVLGEDGADMVRYALTGTGNRQLLVYFKILEGEFAGEVLPWFGHLTKASWKRTMEALRLTGFKGDDLMQAETQALDQKVEIDVGWNTWEDKTHARVDWVNKLGGGAIKLKSPMSKDQVRQFAAQMKANLGKIPDEDGERHTNGTSATGGGGYGSTSDNMDMPPPPDDQGFGGEDDDIPF